VVEQHLEINNVIMFSFEALFSFVVHIMPLVYLPIVEKEKREGGGV